MHIDTDARLLRQPPARGFQKFQRQGSISGRIDDEVRLECFHVTVRRSVTRGEAVQKQLGKDTSKAEAERAVTAVINTIKAGVKKAKMVQLVGFGTFKVVERKARKGFNPKTRQQIRIPKSKTVKFSPGKDFKSKV